MIVATIMNPFIGKIPKRRSEAVNWTSTDNTIADRKRHKQTIFEKILHRKLKIEDHESHLTGALEGWRVPVQWWHPLYSCLKSGDKSWKGTEGWDWDCDSHLWHRYSVTVILVKMAIVVHSKWLLHLKTTRNPWFSMFLVTGNPLFI